MRWLIDEECKTMDYRSLMSRTWNVIWEHKFPILLGILVALGSSSVSSGGRSIIQLVPGRRLPGQADWKEESIPPLEELGMPVIPVAVALVLVGVAIIITLVM
jgi:hypothetical protein